MCSCIWLWGIGFPLNFFLFFVVWSIHSASFACVEQGYGMFLFFKRNAVTKNVFPVVNSVLISPVVECCYPIPSCQLVRP